jgi:hypothetical protein
VEKPATWFEAFNGPATSYKELSELWEPAQLTFGERAFTRAIAEIQRDIDDGKIPTGLSSFDDLKGVNGRAGAYGGLWEWDIEEEGARLFIPPADNGQYCGSLVGYTRACAVIRQRIHEWLKSRSVTV